MLARLPGAPKGTKGISLFLVPKFLVKDDGSLGDRNSLRCEGIEHKMGLTASPTCVMRYDERDWLAGGRALNNRGMKAMFTMMNAARLYVGVQGLGLAEVAYQNALAYARSTPAVALRPTARKRRRSPPTRSSCSPTSSA